GDLRELALHVGLERRLAARLDRLLRLRAEGALAARLEAASATAAPTASAAMSPPPPALARPVRLAALQLLRPGRRRRPRAARGLRQTLHPLRVQLRVHEAGERADVEQLHRLARDGPAEEVAHAEAAAAARVHEAAEGHEHVPQRGHVAARDGHA